MKSREGLTTPSWTIIFLISGKFQGKKAPSQTSHRENRQIHGRLPLPHRLQRTEDFLLTASRDNELRRWWWVTHEGEEEDDEKL